VTEDDTFNRLRRPTFDEMSAKLHMFHRTAEYLTAKDQQEASAIFLNIYGWGIGEYVRLLNQNIEDDK